MSAAIKNSLNKLTSSLVKLEKAIDSKQAVLAAPAAKKAGKTPQDDLFSAMTAGQANPSNINPQNVRMLATRLDTAIQQVEQILKEGRG